MVEAHSRHSATLRIDGKTSKPLTLWLSVGRLMTEVPKAGALPKNMI